jgi:TatD DNase family protein
MSDTNLQKTAQLADIKFIDAHAHVHFDDFDEVRHDVVARCADAGVGMLNVGTTIQTSKDALQCEKDFGAAGEVTGKPAYIRTIVGIHPIYASTEMQNPNWLAELEHLIANNKVVGIGEIGIDVFRVTRDEEIARELKLQEECFRAQLDLAIKYDLPIMIHARESYHHILPILKEYFIQHGAKLRGDAHFFAGSIEEAQAFLDLGFTLSFTGVITFAKEYAKLVEFTPIDRILIETDCPYVTPVPFRGKQNEPIHVREILAKIAQIKGIAGEAAQEELRAQILQNTVKLFKLA